MQQNFLLANTLAYFVTNKKFNNITTLAFSRIWNFWLKLLEQEITWEYPTKILGPIKKNSGQKTFKE